jgi:hypothetical protein
LIIGSWLTKFVPGIEEEEESWGGSAQPQETQEKCVDGASVLKMLEGHINSEGGADRRENTTCNREEASGGNTEATGRKKRNRVNADQIATKRIAIVRKHDTVS